MKNELLTLQLSKKYVFRFTGRRIKNLYPFVFQFDEKLLGFL